MSFKTAKEIVEKPYELRDDRSVEIKLCFKCKGYGFIIEQKLVDYHRRDYETHQSECQTCLGTGRLKYTTTVIKDRLNYM